MSRVIDNATCVKWHTTFLDKLWITYRYDSKRFANQFPNCEGYHENWKTKMKDATCVNIEVITNSDCRICHVDNALFIVEKFAITLDCSNGHGD